MGQEARVRPQVPIFGKMKPAFGLSEQTPKLGRRPVVSDQETIIIAHGDQVAVEEPVSGGGEGEDGRYKKTPHVVAPLWAT